MKFSIKDFCSKSDQIRSILQIWLHLLKKSLMENFIFCGVKLDSNWLIITLSQLEYPNLNQIFERVNSSKIEEHCTFDKNIQKISY